MLHSPIDCLFRGIQRLTATHHIQGFHKEKRTKEWQCGTVDLTSRYITSASTTYFDKEGDEEMLFKSGRKMNVYDREALPASEGPTIANNACLAESIRTSCTNMRQKLLPNLYLLI